MYRKIIVGYQDTEQGGDALRLGRTLTRACDAEMVVATVPAEGGRDLAELAQSEDADLLVIGSTHRGAVGRVVPGATAYRLLGSGRFAVAIAPPGFGSPVNGDSAWRPLGGEEDEARLRVIGVGYDGSPAAREALHAAAGLALANDAALRILTVALQQPVVRGGALGGPPTAVPAESGRMQEVLHEAVAGLPPETRALPVFLRGFPAAELLDAAECGIDLLVLGSEAGGPVRRAFLGSVSTAVLAAAACPVLISPSGVRAPQPTPPKIGGVL